MNNNKKIIVALDFADKQKLINLTDQLDPSLCNLKIGFESFLRYGPNLVEHHVELGFDVFLDLKFHDIPNTVAAACRAAADMGVWMVNVHASGGSEMITAASHALDQSGTATKLLAVTVLTSMDEQGLREAGVQSDTDNQVVRLAKLANNAGADGVVCSAKESRLLRANMGDDFLLVTPGIRPLQAEVGDQKRVMTPDEAVTAGSDYLVIGRPIIRASDPLEVIRQINVTLSAI